MGNTMKELAKNMDDIHGEISSARSIDNADCDGYQKNFIKIREKLRNVLKDEKLESKTRKDLETFLKGIDGLSLNISSIFVSLNDSSKYDHFREAYEKFIEKYKKFKQTSGGKKRLYERFKSRNRSMVIELQAKYEALGDSLSSLEAFLNRAKFADYDSEDLKKVDDDLKELIANFRDGFGHVEAMKLMKEIGTF